MKTIYCPTKILRPIVVDIAQAMRSITPGDFLEVISDQAFMVGEARAFAHMHGCEVTYVAHREVKTINLCAQTAEQFRWDNAHLETNHEWMIRLKK